MAPSFLRAEPTKTCLSLGKVFACLSALSCASYQPAPVALPQLLQGLEEIHFSDQLGAMEESEEGPTLLAYVQFALEHNPSLQAKRKQLGIATSLMEAAGLLPNPELSWDGADVLAAQGLEGRSAAVDAWSGFGLSLRLPRIGERAAQKEKAAWHVEETRLRLLYAEWKLAEAVALAIEDVRAAKALVEQNHALLKVARATRDYFSRALVAGAATALQKNLAEGDLWSYKARQWEYDERLMAARQHWNFLLGLPPETILLLPPRDAANSSLPDLEGLVTAAMAKRPDVAAMQAVYEQREQELRIEIQHQFPELTIGTLWQVVPELFNSWNQPAIQTARLRRDAARLELQNLLHELRAELHLQWQQCKKAEQQVSFYQDFMLPNAEQSLQLAQSSFAAGEVTLLEILAAQRNFVAAQTRSAEAMRRWQKCRWRLLASSGTLFVEGFGDLFSSASTTSIHPRP